MELILPAAETYAETHTSPDAPEIQAMHEATQTGHAHAHMLSSHVQGKLLAMLSNILNPKYVLEIGTFTGYSALCMVDGLAEDGELHTIELRQEDADTAKANFIAAKKENKVTLHVGNAKEIIPGLPFHWDLVFIDADKTGYIEYYEMVLPRLSEKGVIIADNVLFHGQVLENPVKGKNALAIDAFNKHVAADPRVEQVMLTVRDGLMMIKKK